MLQYINRSSEEYLGFRLNETLGRSLVDQYLQEQSPPMKLCLTKGREWHGPISLKRKANDPIPATCKAVPVVCAGR